MLKTMFVVWAPYQRRAEILAQHLDACLEFVYRPRAKSFLGTPISYAVQALRTWRVLEEERPEVVFVGNPPIFVALLASLYARRHEARYVIDSHTGAFLSRKWRWSVALHRRLSQRALTTIVHNTSQEEIVRGWGCRYMVIGFTPGHYPAGEDVALAASFKLAVVSSFRADEPLDLVLEAAGRLPEVSFYITGDSSRVPRALLAKKPENCEFTGYISYERYVGLLRSVDAIMVLTTVDNTLLMGGFEAVSVGTPLIVSDWPILKDYFSLGAVYVPNTIDGICAGVNEARRNNYALRQEIGVLQGQLQTQWVRQLAELRRLLDESDVAPAHRGDEESAAACPTELV